MAKGEKLLTAREVAGAGPGRHSDGGGLYLEIDSANRRRWIWRYRIRDKRRDMGLGATSEVTLAQARAEREKWRIVLRGGGDPIEIRAKRQSGGSVATTRTFGEVVDAYIGAREKSWRNEKHRKQWRMTLDVYAKSLTSKEVSAITTGDVLDVLTPLWHVKPETASRLRGRIESILNAAKAYGYVGDAFANPARWKGHLENVLPRRKKLTRGHHAAMPFVDVPNFVTHLRTRESVSARAVEFTILTAARTSETLLAAPEEFDLDAAVWTVPAERMKAGREHRVPLTPRAIEIVRELRDAFPHSRFVFPSPRPQKALSNMALAMFLRKNEAGYTVHGFRSSFSDWRGETTSHPRELAEAALAHVIGDETEAAYRRGDALQRRRALMADWATYLDGGKSADVIHLDGRQQSRRGRRPESA